VENLTQPQGAPPIIRGRGPPLLVLLVIKVKWEIHIGPVVENLLVKANLLPLLNPAAMPKVHHLQVSQATRALVILTGQAVESLAAQVTQLLLVTLVIRAKVTPTELTVANLAVQINLLLLVSLATRGLAIPIEQAVENLDPRTLPPVTSKVKSPDL